MSLQAKHVFNAETEKEVLEWIAHIFERIEALTAGLFLALTGKRSLVSKA